MAILTESELEIRLNHYSNAAKGRNEGCKPLPPALREVVGFAAHFETAKEVAKAFGVSPSTAHESKDGRGNVEVHNKIKERLGKVRDEALEKMLLSLGVITPDKIKGLKVESALKVAEGMARIIESTGGQDQVNNTQVVIYAPQVRDYGYDKVIEIEHEPSR